MSHATRTTCRLCNSIDLVPLFSLGEQFVSDFVDGSEEELTRAQSRVADKIIQPLVKHLQEAGVLPQTEQQPEVTWPGRHRVPIDIILCRRCTLVQQRHTAPQDFLYSRHYWYRSGTTDTMRAALKDVTTAIEKRIDLKPGDVVLDIGANDGTLLNQYRICGDLFRVACEPAKNLWEECKHHCDVLIPEMWSADTCKEAMRDTDKDHGFWAKIITAIGMFYDLEDPNTFIRDVAAVLHPDGIFVAQLMCLKQTVRMLDVGNFCHEHLEFYSLRSLQWLFGAHVLEIFDIEENDVNGGSCRIFARHKSNAPVNVKGLERVRNAFMEEDEMRLNDPETYQFLFQEMVWQRDEGIRFIRKVVSEGKKVWVFGASTKGNVIAQWLGLTSSLIEAAVDRSQEKVGKFMVGTGIPIRSEAEFRQANPDFALVMPHAFLPEFCEREAEWRSKGGKFLVLIPQFKVV